MTFRISAALVFASVAAASCADEGAHAPGKVLEPLTVQGPERSVAKISWPAAPIDEATRGRLSKASQEAARRSPVPVLVPRANDLASAAIVMAEENWYAVQTRAEEIFVRISATRVAHRVEGVAPVVGPEALRGTRGFVTQNEGIWSATWSENGASYVLDVECARAEDARCASGAFVRSLVEDLGYVGGAGEEVAR